MTARTAIQPTQLERGAGQPTQDDRPVFADLLILFLTALAVRVIYSLILYMTMGVPGLSGEDSAGFLKVSAQFAAALKAGTVAGWDWLGPDLTLMPAFTWILAGLHLIAGESAVWCYVLLNDLADAATCLLVVGIAMRFRTRYAFAAGWFYALVPTAIVLAGFVYTDTLFGFFATLSLWMYLRWIDRRKTGSAALFGVALGLATLIRAVIAPWAVFVFVIGGFIALFSPGRRGSSLGQLTVAGLVALLLVSPVLIRNVAKHDAFAMTPQNGVHWLYWVVPFVQQSADGSARETTIAKLRQHPALKDLDQAKNVFAQSAILTSLAMKELQRLGWKNVARTWSIGMAINLGVPAVSIMPPARKLARPSYYGTAGQGTFGKVTTYLEVAVQSIYGWLLILGLGGVVLFRLLQMVGFIACLRAAKGPTLILFAWCLYILLISGPIASPKYRLPLEPALAVFAGAGWVVLRRRKY